MKKFFPHHPATLEAHGSVDGTISLELLKEFSWKEEAGNDYSYAGERDLGDAYKEVYLTSIDDSIYGYFKGETNNGFKIIVRPYSQYDPVRMGISAYPWPVSVAQDFLDGENSMSLNALVDDNGDVATLMLDSPTTSYLRYTGQWFMLTDIEAIGDYDIVSVEDNALDLYDPADQSGKSVKITSMPVSEVDDFRVQVRYSGESEADALKPLLTETITASLTVPTIASVRDLPTAVEFAESHPEFQWYVERRSRALGLEMEFPWRE
jgi:hypothetical protein